MEAVKLVESGAILAEDFDGPQLDLSRWRVWQPTDWVSRLLMDFTPPDRPDEKIDAWRRRLLGLAEIPPPAAGRRTRRVGDGSPTAAASQFDVVVVGGGLAGCSAALTAAPWGLEVAPCNCPASGERELHAVSYLRA